MFFIVSSAHLLVTFIQLTSLVNEGPSYKWLGASALGLVVYLAVSKLVLKQTTPQVSSSRELERTFNCLTISGLSTYFFGLALIGFDNIGVGEFLFRYLGLGLTGFLGSVILAIKTKNEDLKQNNWISS